MSQNLNTGNSIVPLSNVSLMVQLIERLQQRAHGLPGMGVLSGPSGFGKTFAAAYASAKFDVIHVSVQELWTKRTLLEKILEELGEDPKHTIAATLQHVIQCLAMSGRSLIIDEADYAEKRNMLGVIRDIHDNSQIPIILIGMERLPQKLQKMEQFANRILKHTQAQPANMQDARMLAGLYAQGIDIAEDLVSDILQKRRGRVRRMVMDFAHIVEESNEMGLVSMSLADWGDRSFPSAQAPEIRRDWDAT